MLKAASGSPLFQSVASFLNRASVVSSDVQTRVPRSLLMKRADFLYFPLRVCRIGRSVRRKEGKEEVVNGQKTR